MCGFVGVLNLNGETFSLDNLRRMANTIAHRGPDGEGYFIEENVALAHRRLAIIDTSDLGAQPMTSANNNWVLAFNGCIYNYKELREELKSKGHSFRSTSDTEVITEGLSCYGVSFFEKLNGMFAIAAWNKTEKALYLSRDRYGIKPLYYWFRDIITVFLLL